MPSYRCTVSDRAGRISRIVRRAEGPEQLVRDLTAAQLSVIEVRLVDERALRAPATLRLRSLLELTEGLAVLLESSVSLRDALELLEGVVRRRDAARLTALIRARVEKGESLATAIQGLGGFPSLYGAILALGERTGRLDQVLRPMARFVRQRVEMRDKAMTAMAYPTLVLVTSIALVAFLALYAGPRLSAVPAAMGSSAPEAFSRLGQSFGNLIVALASTLSLIICLLLTALVTPPGAKRWALFRDRLLLRIPGIGRAVRLFEGRALVFALDALTQAGVAVEDALREALAVIRNQALRAALARSRDAVLGGAPLSLALSASGELPADLAQWAAIGEQSGDVPGVFAHLYRSYTYRVDRLLAGVTNLLEPALIIVVGAVVLWIVHRHRPALHLPRRARALAATERPAYAPADEGWTFIETLAVVAIILILTAAVGFVAVRWIASANRAAGRTQVETLSVALAAYFVDAGTHPTAEQGLAALWEKPVLEPVPKNWNGPYLAKPVPRDPWGFDYEYRVPGPHGLPYGIRSLGADGKEGGDGQDADIESWSN